MLITAALLYAYNGIEQKEDETSQQLIEIHIGTVQKRLFANCYTFTAGRRRKHRR